MAAPAAVPLGMAVIGCPCIIWPGWAGPGGPPGPPGWPGWP